MNERERWQRVFGGEAVDRPPLLDESVRDEVIAAWRGQGLPSERTHLDVFGLTPLERVGPDIRPRRALRDRIMDVDLAGYRRAFDVSPDRFPADWGETAARLADRDHVACLWASRGFFQALGVGDWASLRPVLRATLEDPAGVRDRLAAYGDFCAGMLDLALRDVRPDFVYLGEAISDNRGPLISPAMFEDFAIPVYEKVIAVARAHGVRDILLGTYGNTTRLLPLLVGVGVNIVWYSEAAEVPDTDYRAIRERFPDLGLVGGVPLSLLREGTPARIRARLAEIVTPLLEGGRYVPLASGRVREEIPWATYRCYREVLNELVGGPSP